VKKRISTGFGTTIPNPTFVAAKSLLTSMHGGAHAQQGVDTSGEVSQTPDAAKVKAALERTIPPHVLRMMEALRREIRKLEEQARQEEQAENGAAEESCHSPAAAVAEEQSSTAQSDQPLQYQPDFPSAADEYGAYMGEDGGEEQQQQQEQQQNENTESYDGQGYFQSASQQNLTPPAPTTTGSAGGVESSDDAYASDAFDSPSSPGGGSPATRSKAKLLHPIASHLYQPPEIENEWTSVEKHDRRLELGVQTTQAERLNFQPPAGVYAAPARRYVQIIQSADPVREGNAVPKSPHVVLAERGGVGERKFDHLLGDSGVFSEALLLRTIGSPSTTAQASRLAAYDAYTAEKNTSLHHLQAEFPEVAAAPADRMEPVKAARQTRPLSGTPKKPVPPPPATLTEVHDALGGFTVLANGEVEFVSKHESEAKTEPIDFSQFANLGL
jgi:hypothetical protein